MTRLAFIVAAVAVLAISACGGSGISEGDAAKLVENETTARDVTCVRNEQADRKFTCAFRVITSPGIGGGGIGGGSETQEVREAQVRVHIVVSESGETYIATDCTGGELAEPGEASCADF